MGSEMCIRDRRGARKISRQTYAEELTKEYGEEHGKTIPMSASVKLE